MRMYPVALSMVLSAVAVPVTHAQSAAWSPAVPAANQILPQKKDLLEQIKVCQDTLHNAEAIHAAPPVLANIEATIGGLYQDVGAYPQAEAALEAAVNLLHDGPPIQRATALGNLAMLHTLLGQTRKSIREDREAIAVFEQAGDRENTAFQYADLTNAEVKEKRYSDAVQDAQKGLAALAGVAPKDYTADRIALHQALGYALASAGRCKEAIPELKGTVELAKNALGADSLAVGIDTYMLGHAAWQCGDPADAAGWMQRGIDRMKPDLGWGHVVYLDAVAQYAIFLRQRGQPEQAAAEERELRVANSVVDARSMAAPGNGLR